MTSPVKTLAATPPMGWNSWKQVDIADFTTELTQRVQPHETVLLKITGE